MTTTKGAKPAQESHHMEERPVADNPDDIPGMEPWIWAMVIAFIPLVATFFIPRERTTPVFLLSAAIFVVSFVLLVRQERRKRRRK